MKNIHQRDMIKLWEKLLQSFPDTLMLDKENGYIYIKKFLWYTDSKVAEDNKEQLNSLILENLPTNDGEQIMRTIADGYIEKGMQKGILQTALKMLQQNLDLKLISSVTGLSSDELLKLKNKTQIAS